MCKYHRVKSKKNVRVCTYYMISLVRNSITAGIIYGGHNGYFKEIFLYIDLGSNYNSI